jgi:hypothetical protein
MNLIRATSNAVPPRKPPRSAPYLRLILLTHRLCLKPNLTMIKLKIFFAHWISKHLAREARVQRRALRDHLRQEASRIRKLEFRSRGLRLYAAWVAKGTLNVSQTHAEDWHQTALPQAAREIDSKTPAAA